MLNQIVLVGRIKEFKEVNQIILGVSRSYKNEQGEYEVDDITINYSDDTYNSIKEYCQITDMIGVKGRVETRDNQMIIINHKTTFLTSKKGADSDE